MDGSTKEPAGVSVREPRCICMMLVVRVMCMYEARRVLIAVQMFGNLLENILIQYNYTM